MQIRQSTGQGKNVKRDSERERGQRGQRGQAEVTAQRETQEKTEGTKKNRQKQSDFSSDGANSQVLEAVDR